MKHKSLFLFILSLFAFTMSAQSGTVQGKVETADGKPAAFVNISIEGTTKGAVSDESGQFLIQNVTAGEYKIIASFVGLDAQSKKISVNQDAITRIFFTLEESLQTLNEVIISSERNKYYTELPSSSLRIQTPILETPQNIQTVTGSLLNDQQIFEMTDGIERNISGAQRLEHWETYARINVRGSRATPFRNGMNVQISNWGPLSEDMSMVERIEFVKGPAGFMLANGEPGGFYNVVTKKPTGIPGGAVSMSLGSFDTYRLTTDLDGKLSKDGKLLYRFNVMGQSKGSYRDFEKSKRYSFAGVLRYLVSDQTTLTLEYNQQFARVNVIGSNYSFSRRGYGDLSTNFTLSEPNMDPVDMVDQSIFASVEHQISQKWQLIAQVSYMRYQQEGQSIWPGMADVDNDSLIIRNLSIWDALGDSKNSQVFVYGSEQTGSISHQIMAGIDLNHKDYYADWNQGGTMGGYFNIYDPEYGTVAANDYPEFDRTDDIKERGVHYNNGYTGLYIQDQLGFFNDKLRVTLAGRYNKSKTVNPYSGTKSDEMFTPRFGISWSVRSDLSTYFLYDETFLPNFGTGYNNRPFDPVVGNNLEIGVKKDWFDGRWNMGLSLYQITKNNVLTTDVEHPILDSNGQPTGQFYQKETGQQKVKGVELDVRGEVIPNLQLIFNYAYTDGSITKDSNPELVGNRIPGATKHLHNTWLTYNLRDLLKQNLRLSLGYSYQGERSSWFIFDKTEASLPDYFRLDGGLGYAIENVSFNLTVNNILDEYLYSGAPTTVGSSNGQERLTLYYWQVEPPRNYRFTVNIRF
ncbi:TonB-dependent receptor [Mangrovivirga sp. M17]|uniref:TonB-dependent receptor n=1 Tax=Mangrovivirga halotolerans TaxID=2993936 RepID=A0ABT3RTL4_9BACT|nr:TonB-dependent receptor [Mangrovivirga halotolerans]MCX2745129.1 TonB-dependent receptor [Mangrovivirga halotolerans]